MAAHIAGQEEITVTAPDTIDILYRVGVIFTIEGCLKGFKGDAVAIFRIALCFFDLADHSIVQFASSLNLSPVTKRHMGARPMCLLRAQVLIGCDSAHGGLSLPGEIFCVNSIGANRLSSQSTFNLRATYDDLPDLAAAFIPV